MSIIFYSTPSIDKRQTSPNTWRTRMCLKLKGLPFETQFIEYPAIQSFQIENGFEPTGKRPDGSPKYTLPAIFDQSTGAKITDSWNIAVYLDKTYPNTPKLLPEGTLSLQRAWAEAAFSQLYASFPFIAPWAVASQTEASVSRFTSLVEAATGKTLDDVMPRGEDAVREWAKVKDGFQKIDAWYAAGDNDVGGVFIGGATPVFADIVVICFLLVQRRAWGNDGEKWKEVASWNNGRWAELVTKAEKLDIV